MVRTIKERLAAGELVRTFAMGRMVHPLMEEMYAEAGDYHGFWIDEEHVNHTSEQLRCLQDERTGWIAACGARPLGTRWSRSAWRPVPVV